MNAVVIYKSKYGSTQSYAQWISEELGCDMYDAGSVKIDDILKYDTVIYGGGLYAEVIAGVSFITRNMKKLKDKKIIVYTTGITPIECRDYYDKLVMEKNFKNGEENSIKVFNFLGKMIINELSLVHRTAIKSLKKLMSGKENPSEMEKLLVELCDCDGDYTDRDAILPLIEYAQNK